MLLDCWEETEQPVRNHIDAVNHLTGVGPKTFHKSGEIGG